jgi:L-aspartate oxidase
MWSFRSRHRHEIGRKESQGGNCHPRARPKHWAQGGIIFQNPDDPTLVSDIQNASSQTSLREAAEILSREGGSIFKEVLLDKVKVNFDKSDSGDLKLTKEAAHSVERIAYKGDFTGREIQISFLNYLKDKTLFPNVTILTGHTAVDLITPHHHGVSITQRYENNRILGAYLYDQESLQVIRVMARVMQRGPGVTGMPWQEGPAPN